MTAPKGPLLLLFGYASPCPQAPVLSAQLKLSPQLEQNVNRTSTGRSRFKDKGPMIPRVEMFPPPMFPPTRCLVNRATAAKNERYKTSH
jgi:hypothetical protein